MVVSLGEIQGQKKVGDHVSGEPVGLAKGRKDSILYVLDPELFVDPKVLGDCK